MLRKGILRTDYDLDALIPITPKELANAFDDPAPAHQFAQGMTVASRAEGPPTETQGRLDFELLVPFGKTETPLARNW
jgi:hypothetical protein